MISDSNLDSLDFYSVSKRVVDIFGSLFLIVLFSPIMLLAAIAIKIVSPGPALVEKTNLHMKRYGKAGSIFRLYKFRSMMVKADILEKTDPKYRDVYIEKRTKGNYKSMNDPRVTKVGRFIRKHSIDEMPQLFNVLKGEMSIVGPRAYLPEELKEQQKLYPHTKKLVDEVLKVKPGITGFWQVSGRSEVNFDKRIEMDAFYAKKRSILFDFIIIAKTPWAMISGKGAV